MAHSDTLTLIGIFVAIVLALFQVAKSRPTTQITQNFYGDVKGAVNNDLSQPPDTKKKNPPEGGS